MTREASDNSAREFNNWTVQNNIILLVLIYGKEDPRVPGYKEITFRNALSFGREVTIEKIRYTTEEPFERMRDALLLPYNPQLQYWNPYRGEWCTFSTLYPEQMRAILHHLNEKILLYKLNNAQQPIYVEPVRNSRKNNLL